MRRRPHPAAQVVMSELAVKQAALKEVVDKLAALATELAAAKAKKAALQAEYELCLAKLDRAGKLIGGLGGEKARVFRCLCLFALCRPGYSRGI